MRHGAAVSAGHGPDDHRFLTRSGRQKSLEVAASLRDRGHAPTHVYTSPLVRAVQTAELLVRAASLPGPAVVHAPLTPSGTTAMALSVLDVHAGDDVVALVTHEPIVRALAGHLSGLGGAFPGFRTSGVAVLEITPRGARLLGRLHPDGPSWRDPDDLAP